jgi:hypothetical protein
MLLTDGNPNDTLALTIYETEILNVAATESIDLEQKLTLATIEISQDVLDILLDHTRTVDPLPNARRTRGVSDVVVSPQMKRWHALHTLALVYRDAFNNQLNDRYQVKWREYELLTQDGRAKTLKFGIGTVSNPVPQAAAPVVGSVSGNGAGGTFYVRVSWISAMGQEGAPSVPSAITVAAGNDLTVQAVGQPTLAAGFNVYVGTEICPVTLQNSTPLALGATFTMPGSGLISGAPAGSGQSADVYITGGPLLRRG